MIDGPETHEDAVRTYAPGAPTARAWGAFSPTTKAGARQSGKAQMTVVRAIMVSGQPTARRSWRWELRLEPGLELVGEANTAAAGVALAQDQRPDIVVMDVEMPVMDGVQAAERLHALAPDCVIMLVTLRYDFDAHERGKAAGARVVLQRGDAGIFRHVFHDLVQFVKARNTPAWPEIDAAFAQ